MGENGECMRSCGETLFQTGYGACGARCPSPAQYLAWDGDFGHWACVSGCSGGFFTTQAGGLRTCVSGCGSAELARVSPDGALECVSECSEGELSNEAGFCVDGCGLA